MGGGDLTLLGAQFNPVIEANDEAPAEHPLFTEQQKAMGPSFAPLPLPPAHEHWGIYFQLCVWDVYLGF